MAEPSRLQNTAKSLFFELVAEGRLAQLQSLINNKRFSQAERETLINSVDEEERIINYKKRTSHESALSYLGTKRRGATDGAVGEEGRDPQEEELRRYYSRFSALHVAVYFGRESIIRWLLSDDGGRAAGFTSVLAKTSAGRTALHLAAQWGHLPSLQALVEGCKVENGEREALLGAVDDTEKTVLHFAASFGNDSVVRWLLSDSGGRAVGFDDVLAKNPSILASAFVCAAHRDNPSRVIAFVEGCKIENGEREQLLSSFSEALRAAVTFGQESMIRWLLSDSGCQVFGHISTDHLFSALRSAAQFGHVSCMLAVLEGCKDEEREELINSVCEEKSTLLHYAACRAREEVVRWLLSDSGGRAVGFKDVLAEGEYRGNALHCAASGLCELPTVLALVEGCKPEERVELLNALDNHRSTVLHRAAERGNESIVGWLLSDSGGRAAGFQGILAKDKAGNTALHRAADSYRRDLENFVAVVEGCKVENGEREEMLNAVNENSRTVLHIAVQRGNKSVLQWLLSDSGGRAAGFQSVLAKDNEGNTALHNAALAENDKLTLIQAVVEGCKVEIGEREEMLNAVGYEGRTILHREVRDVPSLQWLLSDSGGRAAGLKSSTITSTTTHGESALHWAAQYQSVPGIRALLLGCTVGERLTLFLTIEEHGWSVLHWAARYGNSDIIQELLLHHPETKTIVNHRDHRGMTALHRAVLNGGLDEESRKEWSYYCVLDDEERMQVIEALLTYTTIDDEEDPQAARLDVNLGLKSQ